LSDPVDHTAFDTNMLVTSTLSMTMTSRAALGNLSFQQTPALIATETRHRDSIES
jgi:hypothetical protein